MLADKAAELSGVVGMGGGGSQALCDKMKSLGGKGLSGDDAWPALRKLQASLQLPHPGNMS